MKQKIPSSYDIIGSREKAVAIVEIPDELKNKEKEIAKQIMSRHKNVKSVLKKISKRRGVFRTRDYKWLIGEKNTEVMHAESGCKFKLDPRKVYFSPRESTERQRIASFIKPDEKVLVLFSGVSPFSIIAAKKQPRVDKIYAIELNKTAHDYATENVRINKLEHKINLIHGDVREILPKMKEKFNRIIMPLPHDAEKFLDLAYKRLKPKGTIHLYLIEKEEEVQNRVKRIITNFKRRIKKNVDYGTRKVLSYAPRINKYCVDINVLQP